MKKTNPSLLDKYNKYRIYHSWQNNRTFNDYRMGQVTIYSSYNDKTHNGLYYIKDNITESIIDYFDFDNLDFLLRRLFQAENEFLGITLEDMLKP